MVKSLQGGLRRVQSWQSRCKVGKGGFNHGKVVARRSKVGSIMVKSLQDGLSWVQSW